jgi:hypothetical protein
MKKKVKKKEIEKKLSKEPTPKSPHPVCDIFSFAKRYPGQDRTLGK